MSRHRVEAFIDERMLTPGRSYGWQCYTCGVETVGLPTMAEARQGCDQHRAGGQ